jgi:CheY-like chemotaxis protein
VKDKGTALEHLAQHPSMVIFDLNCGAAEPLELIRSMKQNPATSSIPTIGFISHVQAALKQEAQEAGCDTVVARSVFAQNLPSIMAAQVRAAE